MTTLEKIREEIEKEYKWLMRTKCSLNDIDIAFSGIKSVIDKYADQEPCDDAVSREYAIRKLRTDTLFVCTGDKMQAISDIEGLPPVTPQQKDRALD